MTPAPTTRVALQVAAAAGLATALGHLLPIERPQWAVISAALVIGASWGESLRRSWQRVLGTLAGAVIGLVAVTVLHGLAVEEAVAAFAALFAMLYAGSAHPVALAGLVTVIIALMLGILVDAGPHLLLVRIYETGLGVGIAVVVSGLLFLTRSRDGADEAIDGYLEAMGDGIAAALAAPTGRGGGPVPLGLPGEGLDRAETMRARFTDLRYEGVLLGRTARRVTRLEVLLEATGYHAAALTRAARPVPDDLDPPIRAAIAVLADRLAARIAGCRARGATPSADDAAFVAAQETLRTAVLASDRQLPVALVELAYHAARLDAVLASLDRHRH